MTKIVSINVSASLISLIGSNPDQLREP